MQTCQRREGTTGENDGMRHADGLDSRMSNRLNSDETLRRERDFVSAVLDIAGALVVVLDRDGRIVRFNRACERTTGYTFDEVQGKLLWNLFLIPEEVEPVKAVFGALRAGQFPNEYENHWLTKDGGRRPIAWSNTALLGADGRVEYVVGTGIDVTERKLAESQRDATLTALRSAQEELERRVVERTAALQAANASLQEEIAERRRVEATLRESEGHMRSLMESARSYAVYRVAVDPTNPFLGRVILASPSMQDLLSIADLDGFATWFDNIHPDDLGRIVEANQGSLETGVPFDQQFRVFHEDRGEWAWVHVRSTPVLDDAGALTHFNGLVVDITEQKRAEEEIRRQSEYLEALHETALGVISRLDTQNLLEAILERALSLVSATYGFVYLIKPEEDEIEVRVGAGPYRSYVGRRIQRGEGLGGRICESGQPLAVEDYHAWSGRSPQFEDVPGGPAMGAPLMSGPEVVGVLGIARSTGAPTFRQDELDLIRRFSHLASIALDNARLYSSAQQHLSELQQAQQALQQRLVSEGLVARISTEFVNLGPAEIDTGIESALRAIGQVAGVDRSYVFQFSGDGTTLDNPHEWCAEGIEPFADALKGMPRAAFPWFLERLERFEVISLPRVAEMPPEASAERAECEREGIQSIIIAPLAYRGMLAGFLGFDAVRAERAWTQDTSSLLTIVGGLIVNALEHKRAGAIQAGQRQFLELLATGGDFSETLHTLVRLIEDQWPGMLGLILLLDEDGRHLHIGAAVSLPEDYVQSIEGLEIGPMVGSCGTACYRRERVIVEDTATDPRWDGLRDLALRYRLRACWSEPVFSADGRVVGTFAMYYRQPRAPTEGELRAIEMGAHLVGVAIEHNRAQEALRESEEKFRGIVEYANVGIAIVQDACFRFVNPHFAAMLGYTIEELLGTEFMGYCAPEERERIVSYYTRRVKGEPVPCCYETAMMHRHGGRVHAEVSAGMIPFGGQRATFVFLRDITPQKQAQQALEEAYQTLEQRVEERTKDLAVLNSIAAVVSGSLDLKEIMSAALARTLEAMDMEFGVAYCLECDGRQAPEVMASQLDTLTAVGQENVGQLLQTAQDSTRQATETGHLRLLAHQGVSAEYAEFATDVRLAGTVTALAQVGKPYAWLVEDAFPAGSDLEQLLDREKCRQVITLPLIAKGGLVGAINLGTRTPRPFMGDQLSLLASVGHQIGVAVENARLYEAEQERRAEAEGRRRVAEGMREILAVLNSQKPLPEILDFIAMQTCRLLHSDAAAILRLEDGILCIQAACGLDGEYMAGMTMRVGEGGAGRAVATRRPVIISDPVETARSAPAEAMPAEPQKGLAQRLLMEFWAVISVPLIIQDQDYGAITVYYRSPRDFSDEDLHLAMSVADQVALAVESARLREQAEKSAALEERGRLARELHDSVTQSLYSVTMYTEAAARLTLAGQESEAAEYLRDARDTAQEALREMRLLIYQLRPPILEQGGLAVALQVRLDAVERRGGIHAELVVQGEDRLAPAIQTELHQIAQEALNNALKHAKAQQVHVRLHFGEARTCLEVQDDGVGFELAAAQRGGGLGLPGMKERVQNLGGSLNIASAPGQGTKVVVEVPAGGGA
jgi:PAS domain S-box-containing protein